MLRRRRATTYWLARDVLRTLGVDGGERHVFGARFATSAGVSAGLKLRASDRRGRVAQAIQLQIGHDPRPLAWAGSPRTAPGELVHALRQEAPAFRQ
jgi:hypothetical protein